MSMICVSLGRITSAQCRSLLKTIDFAEIRLDLAGWTLRDVRRIFALPRTLIATCRPGLLPEAKRRRLLLEAIASGASYVDLEFESTAGWKKEILGQARRFSCRVIISRHDERRTPPDKVLRRIIDRSFGDSADIVKIACRVRSAEDVLRLLALYGYRPKTRGRLLFLGLGPQGILTRLAAPLLGAPFTFASADGLPGTAAGQLEHRTMVKILRQVGWSGK
jgi:3-dehydroquinate dehydratase-1